MQQLVIDSEGRLALPKEAILRHGLYPGSKVDLDESDDKLIIQLAASSPKARSMSDMIGSLGSEPKALVTLMHERRLDREREDNALGS